MLLEWLNIMHNLFSTLKDCSPVFEPVDTPIYPLQNPDTPPTAHEYAQYSKKQRPCYTIQEQSREQTRFHTLQISSKKTRKGMIMHTYMYINKSEVEWVPQAAVYLYIPVTNKWMNPDKATVCCGWQKFMTPHLHVYRQDKYTLC